MSIIYEALKKVQGKTASAAPVLVQPAGKAAAGVFKKSTAVRTAVVLIVLLALGMFLTEILINRWFGLRAKREKILPAAASYIPLVTDLPPSISPSSALEAYPSLEEPITPAQQSPAEPNPQLVLNGIVLSEEGNIALINDQILKAGDTVEGALVEEISGNQVVLSFKARKITLKSK